MLQISLKTVKGTIILILLNILIFIAAGHSSTLEQDVETIKCLRSNFPECVSVPDIKNMEYCSQEIAEKYADLCIYRINEQCLNNTQAYECLTQEEQTVRNLSFIPEKFSKGQGITSLVTSMFMHANWVHLYANMIFLLLIGIFVEKRLGTMKFLLFYVFVGISSALFYFAFNHISPTPLLGASGAIFGLMGANLILTFFRPSDVTATMSPLRVSNILIIILFQMIYSIIDLESNIAYSGHIGGIVAGIVLIQYFRDRNEAPVFQ